MVVCVKSLPEKGGSQWQKNRVFPIYTKRMQKRQKRINGSATPSPSFYPFRKCHRSGEFKHLRRTGEAGPGRFLRTRQADSEGGAGLFGVKISFTFLNVVFNAIPAVFAYRIVGKKFTILSCVSLLTVSILVDQLPVIPITGDLLLISVFGGIINGLGMSLILNNRASGGGTDFIAMSLSTKYKISTFNYMLLFSAVIILISGAIFGMDIALYSIIYQFCNTQVINTLYKKYKKKTLLIVTDNPAAVSADLMELTNHSSTILKGFGSYSANKKYLLYTVLSDGDVKKMKKRIREQYPDTFVNVINSSDVVGNFYIQPLE